jgi:peptidoglycan/xylan/chitin deacetylase (PgdA/CDA1 family)
MRWLLGATGLGLGLAAAHAAPALAWIDPLRCRLAPGLAGLGVADHVALTFDDGPDPASTPQFLEALDRLGWRATFFLLGSMADAAPRLAAEVADAGHETAVHGYHHRGSLRHTPRWVRGDLERAVSSVTRATGSQPRWYRPPFGELSGGALLAARHCRVEPVLWSAWGRDWRAEATAASIVTDLRGGVVAGGTVLLHDSDCASAPGSWKNTLAALEPLAELFAAKGLRVGPLREHFATRPPPPT